MMRILVVDDHPLFREVLRAHMGDCFPEAKVFDAGSVGEAMGVLGTYAGFDLILLDVSMPGMDGVTGLALIREKTPGTPIAILSGTGDAELARVALEAGANGYISKTAGGREIKNALDLILFGEHYISPSVLAGPAAEVLSPSVSPLLAQVENEVVGEYGMTPRQLEVCRLLMVGLPNKLIARRLDCAEGTVRLHVSAVLRALNAHNRTEAARAALRLGIEA
ncbi:response regulator transcription factor [Candidatus Thiothrix sp. Deng01]|uniref:Response regulator transcription factor n=1 Tax=Candidatus Thiothrix phosphatis TaxID=3112415 RepID=A0ABU6CUY3_9GAMM|nr:response regulator transcription factor [Candidatus Thiothrix sp. Deng01]MEB4590651.1 response regulator transcription factor [Candidatus Thiothrix sp. Deng01]